MSDDAEQYRRGATLLRAREDRESGEGATDAQIRRLEESFGRSLRSSYRQFLVEFGWGGAQDLEILGMGEDVPAFLDVIKVMLAERTELQPSLATSLLPLSRDGGGNTYCLHAHPDGASVWEVVLWDHERGATQVPERIAPHFGAWFYEKIEELE